MANAEADRMRFMAFLLVIVGIQLRFENPIF